MDISTELNEIIVAAYREAESRGHEYLTPEHVLYASLFFDRGREIILPCGGNVESLAKDLEGFFEPTCRWRRARSPRSPGIPVHHGKRHHAHRLRGKGVGGDRRHPRLDLRGEGILRRALPRPAGHRSPGRAVLHLPRRDGVPRGRRRSRRPGRRRGARGAEEEPRSRGKAAHRPLQAYAVDLTEKARAGGIDPLIGREEILQRTIQVLCRRLKNNPLHVGEPGVGKTAITEGLAQMIVDGKVPKALRDYRIFALDMGALLAGNEVPRRFRGAAEEGDPRAGEAGEGDPVHRRDPHRGGRRLGLRRLDGRLQHPEARAHLGKGALHRLHDLRGLPQVLRQGPGAVAQVPEDRGARAHRGGDPRHPPGPAREVRDLPRGALHRGGAEGRGGAFREVHQRPPPAGQGHRRAGRGRRVGARVRPGDRTRRRARAPWTRRSSSRWWRASPRSPRRASPPTSARG